MKKFLAVTGVVSTLLLASAPAFALGDRLDEYRQRLDDRQRLSAPEIDVAAGTKGVAVLVAALLLAAEGLRRRL